MLVMAAVAVWHATHGRRAIFDTAWYPRMGAVWAGIERPCVRATSGNHHFCWGDFCGEPALARLRQAVASEDLPAIGRGLGTFLKDAVALRSAALTPTAFFGVRRALEVTADRHRGSPRKSVWIRRQAPWTLKPDARKVSGSS